MILLKLAKFAEFFTYKVNTNSLKYGFKQTTMSNNLCCRNNKKLLSVINTFTYKRASFNGCRGVVVQFCCVCQVFPKFAARPCRMILRSYDEKLIETPVGALHITVGSYRDMRSENFCYDPIPEVLRNLETQSQN